MSYIDTQQSAQMFRAVLHPYRSLSRHAFLILMAFITIISLGTGIAFYILGAWPVLGFCGLDVLAIYAAFKINYRSGKCYELIELSSELLKITRVNPSGKSLSFDFNPYWVRVLIKEWPDGSSKLKLVLHGREFEIGHYLNTDEKKDFAKALEGALLTARAVPAS